MHAPTAHPAPRAVVNPADHRLLQDIDGAQNLVALFLKRADEKGDAPFLGHKTGGQWVTQSWRSAAEHVCLIAEGLRAMGLRDGDRVALASGVNRAQPNCSSPQGNTMPRPKIRMADPDCFSSRRS